MLARAHDERLTAPEFLHLYDGVEGRWELVEGVPVMMSGGSFRHALVAGNIYFALRRELRGKPCQPFGSDAGVGVDFHNIRYPDVAVYCDPRDLDVDLDEKRTGRHPVVLVEVHSPSTSNIDRGLKLRQYKAIPSVRSILFVDPRANLAELYERIGDAEWRETVVPEGEDVPLPAIGVTLSADDIWRVD